MGGAAASPLPLFSPQPFVEIAVKHHNRYEAKKYAPRVTPEQRVKAFILVGCVGSPGGAPGTGLGVGGAAGVGAPQAVGFGGLGGKL